VPGRRIRTSLEYPGEGGGTFDAVGYLAVDERERRMEWGAEEGRDYSGWLTVANHGEGGSEVVVHLSFGERSAGPEIEERAPEGSDPLAEGVSATLESIRRQIEEGSGKVETPPPPEGAEPHLEENPAVVEDLEGKGVEFAAGISEHEWGRVATFKDSEGNDLQLYEPPSG
jgi:hypothetical protein